MKTQTELNHLIACLSAGQRALRKGELKAKARAAKAKARRKNSDGWGAKRQEAYALRLQARKEIRVTHLVQAFLDGKDYRKVEESCREGNEPCPESLTRAVNYWSDGISFSPYDVAEWLGVDLGYGS